MYVINHLCHLEPQSHNTCTRLDLSAAHCDQITSVVEYRVVKANRVDPDDMPYSVEYHLGVLVCS